MATDGGWAWVVLAAASGSHFLNGLLAYFVGVVHTRLLRKFQGPVTTTAWVGALYIALMALAAPLASVLISRAGCRVTGVLGGLLLFAGFTASAFVTSVTQLFFTYGLLAGLGLAFTYSPANIALGFYFRQYLGLATGVAGALGAVGILCGSIIAQALMDHFALTGAFLLIAAISLHHTALAMLYRPTRYERRGRVLEISVSGEDGSSFVESSFQKVSFGGTRQALGVHPPDVHASRLLLAMHKLGIRAASLGSLQTNDVVRKIPSTEQETPLLGHRDSMIHSSTCTGNENRNMVDAAKGVADKRTQDPLSVGYSHNAKGNAGCDRRDMLPPEDHNTAGETGRCMISELHSHVPANGSEETCDECAKYICCNQLDKTTKTFYDLTECSAGEGKYIRTGKTAVCTGNHCRDAMDASVPSHILAGDLIGGRARNMNPSTVNLYTECHQEKLRLPPRNVVTKTQIAVPADRGGRETIPTGGDGSDHSSSLHTTITVNHVPDEAVRSNHPNLPIFSNDVEKQVASSPLSESARVDSNDTVKPFSPRVPSAFQSGVRSGTEWVKEDSNIVALNDAANSNTSNIKDGRQKLPTLWRRLAMCCSVLYQNKPFLLHCAGFLAANIHISGVQLHLPEYAMRHGTSPTRAAALFVAVGALCFVSRVCSGLVATDPHVGGLTLSMGMMGVCGLTTILFPLFSDSYGGQVGFSAVFGLYTGGLYSMVSVLTLHFVPVELLPAAYGLKMFFMGAGVVSGPPLAALIVDKGGTYDHSFIFLGCMMLLGSLLDLSASFFSTTTSNEAMCKITTPTSNDAVRDVKLPDI